MKAFGIEVGMHLDFPGIDLPFPGSERYRRLGTTLSPDLAMKFLGIRLFIHHITVGLAGPLLLFEVWFSVLTVVYWF